MFTIAICDDEEIFGKQIEKVVWNSAEKFDEKIQVAVFTSGEELLEYMRHNPVDLLFLDIELGKMTGIQVSHQIRKKISMNKFSLYILQAKKDMKKNCLIFSR